jgi:hypothetical protein
VAATLVTVILDRYDGAQRMYTRGTATWTPSLEFPDAADEMLIGMAPVTATFRAGRLRGPAGRHAARLDMERQLQQRHPRQPG